MDEIVNLLAEQLLQRGITLGVAESCTGGKISAAVTAKAGSSQYFKGGVVAYSNEVKMNILGVSAEILQQVGAVSEQTVREMAAGVMRVLNTDCAVATSGVAGPDGGSVEKPVGTIWIAAALGNNIRTQLLTGDNGRDMNSTHAAFAALTLLYQIITAS